MDTLSNGIRQTGQISRRGDVVGVDKNGDVDGIGVAVDVVDCFTTRRFRLGVKSDDINRRTALKSEKREKSDLLYFRQNENLQMIHFLVILLITKSLQTFAVEK